jgi:hypothetical protein
VRSEMDEMPPAYDRQLLLFGPKRNTVVELWEVARFGIDTFGDPNYVSIYGLQPDEWYARGIRLLGRTVVECTPDHVASEIGRDIAETASLAGGGWSTLVIDPFAGSANTLHWILRKLPAASGIAFELDTQVYRLTRDNLSLLGSPIELVHDNYLDALRQLKVPANMLVIAFIAPPWGTAFSPATGLDLRGTTPPVREILESLALILPNPMLLAIQVCERLVQDSLTDITTRCDWSALHVYDSNKAAENRNGLLLLTRGWRPSRQV